MIIKFPDLETIDEQEVNAAILRNDSAELELVSIKVALSNLVSCFIQSICIGLTFHCDANVRGNASASLGHLARRFRMLFEQSIKPIIESALLNSHELLNMYDYVPNLRPTRSISISIGTSGDLSMVEVQDRVHRSDRSCKNYISTV
jgi:hypothetical protein